MTTESHQDCGSVSLEAFLLFSQRTPCGGLGDFESVISFSWIIFTQALALSRCGWLFDFQLRSVGCNVLGWPSLESLEVTRA